MNRTHVIALLTLAFASAALLAACPSTTRETPPADPDAPQVARCVARQCGPDPVTHESCGTCADPAAPACNDGRCEATCDAARCAKMSYRVDTCQPLAPCQTAPAGGISETEFGCDPGGTRCLATESGVSCGVIDYPDCTPCDLAGRGDGICLGEACRPLAATSCPARP